MLLTCIPKLNYIIKHIITKPCNKTYLLWDTDFGNKKYLLHSLSIFWNKIKYLQYQNCHQQKLLKMFGAIVQVALPAPEAPPTPGGIHSFLLLVTVPPLFLSVDFIFPPLVSSFVLVLLFSLPLIELWSPSSCELITYRIKITFG